MDFLKDALKSQTSQTGHKPASSHTTNNQEPDHKPDHHQQQYDHHQTQTTPSQTKPHRQPSTSELMASAKVVADAAKAKMNHTDEKFDEKKVAEAASDLLSGVKHYGKLEENAGLGKYVGMAETYLNKYESSHSSGGPTAAGVAEEEKKKKEGHGDGHGSHGGAGDYFKMAEGFLKK